MTEAAVPTSRPKRRPVIPGFGLTLGYTTAYLGLVVLLPLGALVLNAVWMGWDEFRAAATHPRTLSAYRFSLGASAAAAAFNAAAGLLVAWVLVRYRFWGRRTIDALIDLPFALPTAVAGVAMFYLYSSQGWVGAALKSAGFRYPWPQWRGVADAAGAWQVPVEWVTFEAVSYAPLGVVIALAFVGLPFVVRTVQPVLSDLSADVEEAAASLGASRWQTFRLVVLPSVRPALVTGFALSFARGLGEYGSVVFIAGKSNSTNIAPFEVISRTEQHDYAGATAVAVGLMALSFAALLGLNLLQRWAAKRAGEG